MNCKKITRISSGSKKFSGLIPITPFLLIAAFFFSMPSLTITAEESAIFSEYLSVGGRLQPRYEYTRHQGNKEDLSSFYLRRARIDFRGEMFGEKLTFRIMPELAREATMRDAWLNYEFGNAIQIRAGQMPVPYQWHRFVSSTRQYFAERSIISESFGVPGGYDIGIMLHRKDQANIIQLEAGFFDGSGRNTKLSNSNGNLASGRMSLALMGTLPKSEVSLSRTEEPSLAIGTAIQAANKNESRNWSIGRSASSNYRSSYLSSGADLYFNYKSISIAGEIHHRFVSPDDEDVENYNGTGYMATAGFVILPGRIDIAGRYSELNADNSDATTKHREWGAGINIYYKEHQAKTRLQFLRNETYAPANNTMQWTGAFIIEQHIQF